jgi:cytochrome c oxidase assembly protein subunit 15
MNVPQQRIVFLQRAAMLCAVLVLVITSLSAFIRLSNAGLGCNDWPRCYGQALRDAQHSKPARAESKALTTARLVHRVVAVAVLLLVISMVTTSFATSPILPVQGGAAVALLALALFLAVLGIWTTGARVPAVAMGNLLGGFGMLALCARMAGPERSSRPPHLPTFASTAFAWTAAAVLTGQIVLGALVSATYAGLSCPNLTGCDLSATTGIWETLNPWREPRVEIPLLDPAGGQAPVNPVGALAHVLHRIGAVVTMLVLLPLSVLAIRRGRRRAGWVLLALLAVQGSLGVLMVLYAIPLPLALAHNLVAALMLAVVVRLAWT